MDDTQTYKTQMEAAKKHIITNEMRIVAEKESMDIKRLQEKIAAGKIIIPANAKHKALSPEGIGEGLKTKINVNLGISRDCADIEQEKAKVLQSIAMKAEAIMDLSSYGKTYAFRDWLIQNSSAMIGTVPIYDAVGYFDRDLKELTKDDFFEVVKKHAEQGVDFMTIHAGINRATMEKFKQNPRLTNIVSRGGSLLYVWMELTGHENPFFQYYDELLDILYAHDVTISLGDACRPGSIQDASDAAQIQELIVLGELTQRAWDKHVQVMVEGPGHMALNEIQANVVMEKRLCHGAPFYVLGPIVTDVAPGYDHITSAIGGAMAAAAGADFLCYVTPAEHLRLPDLEDIKEGIVAAKIAAHAADIAKGIPGAKDWDFKMSTARAELDWEAMFALAIDQEKPKAYRQSSPPQEKDTCTMCGKMCAVKNMNRILNKDDVSLL